MAFLNYTAIEDALHAWVETATGVTSIWADQDGPRPPLPHAMLTWLTGPRGKLGEAFRRMPATMSATVDAAAEDGRAWIRVNRCYYVHDVAAGESAEDVRDALLALMAADIAANARPYTAAASGTDTIDVAPVAVGDVRDFAAGPAQGDTALSFSVATYDTATLTQGPKSWLLQVDVFTCEATGPNAAYALASECLCALELADTRAALRLAGLSSTLSSAVRRLSRTIVDERVESRAAFDVEFSAFAHKATQQDPIDTVSIVPPTAKV